jgi:hypothetical protein
MPKNVRVVVPFVVATVGDIMVNAPLFSEYVYDGDDDRDISEGSTTDIVDPDLMGRITV